VIYDKVKYNSYLDDLDALVGDLQRDLERLLAAGPVHQIGEDRVDNAGAPQPLRLLGAQEPHIVGGLLHVATQAQRHLQDGMCDSGTLKENEATMQELVYCRWFGVNAIGHLDHLKK